MKIRQISVSQNKLKNQIIRLTRLPKISTFAARLDKRHSTVAIHRWRWRYRTEVQQSN